jgi:putative transposase
LYKHITGIVQNQNHKVLAINGMPDHIHVLIGLRPNKSLSDLLQDIKGDSSGWINRKRFVNGKFSWQEGFGAFSYGKSQVNSVNGYIKNQEVHHRKKTFLEEYHEFLEKFEVDYDKRYLFKPVEYEQEL